MQQLSNTSYTDAPTPEEHTRRNEEAWKKHLIMVIDDSATIRNILQVSLGREKFPVIAFADGVEAMRWFAQPEARIPDLVLLDIGLPRLDGFEVARRLKSRPQFHHTTIIMLSRRDGVLEHLKARLAGARGYLTKPFTTQELLQVIETCLAEPTASTPPGTAHYLNSSQEKHNTIQAPGEQRNQR